MWPVPSASSPGLSASGPSGRDDPKVVWFWAFYDRANSAFTTLVVTFIYSTYFTKAMAPDEVTGRPGGCGQWP